MTYNNIIQNIISNKNSVVTFIIDMDNSSTEEIEILKLFLKHIKKKTKITINNDNKTVYFKKPEPRKYKYNPSYNWYGDFDYSTTNIKIKNKNETNILIFKDKYFSSQIKLLSTIILSIDNNEIYTLKNKYDENDETKINIPTLLRNLKLQKLNKK